MGQIFLKKISSIGCVKDSANQYCHFYVFGTKGVCKRPDSILRGECVIKNIIYVFVKKTGDKYGT